MNTYAERTDKTVFQKDKTGIPRKMKANFENSSGFSFDDVRVHYNSEKPAQLHAHAYTQGNEVYVAPGQEKHLPHELGHVVQQKSDMVKPTGEIDGLPLNDDMAMENDADMIAAKAQTDTAPIQGKFKGGVVQRNAVNTPEAYNAWAGFGSSFIGMLGMVGGIGSFLYTKNNDRKHRYIEEIEKYADAACEAREEQIATKQIAESANVDNAERAKATAEYEKLKTKIKRNYNAAMDKAAACGAFDEKRWYEKTYDKVTSPFRKKHPTRNGGADSVEGPPTLDTAMIEKVEDQNIKNALLRAKQAYDESDDVIANNVNRPPAPRRRRRAPQQRQQP